MSLVSNIYTLIIRIISLLATLAYGSYMIHWLVCSSAEGCEIRVTSYSRYATIEERGELPICIALSYYFQMIEQYINIPLFFPDQF